MISAALLRDAAYDFVCEVFADTLGRIFDGSFDATFP